MWSENFYGTDEYSVLDKLPSSMKELVDKGEHYNLPKTYKGIELFWSDAGFHGYGVGVKLGYDHKRTKEKVRKIFKILKIIKPKYCSVSMMSI